MSQWVPSDFPVQQLEVYVCRMFYSTSIVFAVIRASLLISLYWSDLSQQKLIIFFLVFNFAVCIVGLWSLQKCWRDTGIIKFLYSESLNSYFLYQAFWLVPEFKLELTISAFAVIGSFYQIAFTDGVRISIFLTVKQLVSWVALDIMSSPALASKKFSTFVAVFYIVGAYVMLIRIFITLSRTRSHLVCEISEKSKQLTSVLGSIQDGVIVMGSGNVLMYNDAVKKLFECGTSQEVAAVLGKVEKLLPSVDAFLETGAQEYGHFGIFQHSDKQIEWLGSKVLWDQKLAVILTCRDVSELLRLQDLAQKENERKLALMRSISHELRTPMNYVKNVAETMGDGLFRPESMVILLSCCNLMNLLVDEIQDFAQVSNDTITMRDESVDLRKLLDKCVDMVKPYADSKKLALTLAYDPAIPHSIFTDSSRLCQLVTNLLSNAIKYTSIGSVRVVAYVISQGTVKLKVEDTGLGIASHRLPGLFESTSAKALPTSGLGLFMANRLALMLGGKPISVQSKLGHGSSFSFFLRNLAESPLTAGVSLSSQHGAEDDEDTHPAMPEFITGAFLRERLSTPVPEVLIVDDYPFNRLVMRSILEKEGLFTQEAENGYQAILLVQKLRQKGKHLRLIIMDFDMPILDGLSTTKELKEMQRTDVGLVVPPIIGHSAYTSDEDRRQCLEAGMDAFLPKPCSREEALRLIFRTILPREQLQ